AVNMADVGSQHYSSSDSREDSNSQDATKQQSPNIFRNDGSFMEMFKKLQEDQKKREDDGKGGVTSRSSPTPEVERSQSKDHKKTTLSFGDGQLKLPRIKSRSPWTGESYGARWAQSNGGELVSPQVGKRRGGRILATGMVKKQRKEAKTEKQQSDDGKTDAWSQYMSEVRKYKEQSCEEEGKRRPLVK
ncbi:telomerase RNA component interacting Rnase-like, partial [Homarus americanus]